MKTILLWTILTASLHAALDLSSIDLARISTQKGNLVASLQRKNVQLKSKSGINIDEARQLVSARIKRLESIEDVLYKSLNIFDQVTKSLNIDVLDANLAKESDYIIDEFQKLVIAAKNDKIGVLRLKTLEDKQKAAGDFGKVKGAIIEDLNSVDTLIKDVAEKADSLEVQLKEESFKDSQLAAGSSIETVVRLRESSNSSQALLIDSQNNQYVLSKPGDMTSHMEDTSLLQDILILLFFCYLASMVTYLVGLPSFFGFIIAGIIMNQNKLVNNAVQVETISRGLGVILIMFYLGLEFNMSKIARVWTVSLFGSFAIMGATMAVCSSVLPIFLHASSSESLVIGASISLSSTAVVLHFLKPGENETNYGRNIMGILVAQDVLLGFLLAIMPILQKSGIEIVYTTLRLVGFLILFITISFGIRIPALMALQYLREKAPSEVFSLAAIGFLLIYIRIGLLFEQSTELCCFVAGVCLASNKALSEHTIHKLESLRHVFGALFFASIGLHIYPSFLINEGALLLGITALVIVFKIILAVFVLKIVFRKSWRDSSIIAVGLGQISEFAFMLASTAKRYHESNAK